MSKKNKKIGLGFLIAGVVALISAGWFILFGMPNEKVSADQDEKDKVVEVGKEDVSEVVAEEVEEVEEKTVEPYASILRESQKVLKEEDISGIYHLSLLSETAIENETVQSLMKEVATTHDHDAVTLKVFKTEEAFEKYEIDSSDKNSQVEVFEGTSLNGTPSIEKTTYQTVTASTTGHIDDMGYDVQDAVVEEDNVTYQVIVNGNESNLQSFLNGFITLHKDLNPTDKLISLELFLSADDLQAKNPAWVYDGNSITKKESITKESSQ